MPLPLPSRRELLALLGLAPSVVAAAGGTTITSAGPAAPTHADAHRELFDLIHALDQALARREAAIANRDRLEAELVARIGWPRVALPSRTGERAAFVTEPSTIDDALGPGRNRLRQRLKAELARVQRHWAEAAYASGLADAIQAEAAAFIAAQATLAAVLTTPATTIKGAAAKLAVIIAAGEPGPEDRHAFPWWELRILLADLAALHEGNAGPRS